MNSSERFPSIRTLDELEDEVARHLAVDLDPFLRAASDAYNLVPRAIASESGTPMGEFSNARLVSVLLLIRIGNDLRGVFSSARKGYALQAATLAASIFEGAYTIAFIGANDDRAENWIEHPDELRSFESVERLVRGTLEVNLSGEDLQRHVDLERSQYAGLCLAKHLNPVIQKGHGVRQSEVGFDFFNGPAANPETLKVAAIALHGGTRLVTLAAASFATIHLKGSAFTELLEKAREVRMQLQVLSQTLKKRGWSRAPLESDWEQLRAKFREHARRRRGELSK